MIIKQYHLNQSNIVNVLCYGTKYYLKSLSVLNPNTNPNFSYNWENINVPGVSVGTG